MPALVWMQELETGSAEMDSMHREFIDLCNDLVDADDQSLLLGLTAFEEHARRHFAGEDRKMTASEYPAAGCHVDEHKAVLKSIRDVIEHVEGGNLAIGRMLVEELVRWFPEHTVEMDMALTRWLSEKRLGGVPVSIHRRTRVQRKLVGVQEDLLVEIALDIKGVSA